MMMNFSLQWHITQRCNNNCQHCYMEDKSHVLDYGTYKQCIENIETFEKKYDFCISTVSITGGDPLLNPSWFQIASDLNARNKKILFLGNPELLNTTNLELLHSLSILRYQLSLDGLEETHDRIRYNGSFKRTIEAIEALHKHGIPVAIMYTVSHDNFGELEDLILFLNNLDIPILFAFDFVVSIGNAKKKHALTDLPVEKLYENYLRLKQRMLSINSKLVLAEKPSTIFAYKNYKYISEDIVKNIPYTDCGGCGAGWRHLTLINDGDVLACRRMPIKVGNLLESSFEDILLHSPHLINLRKRANSGQCATCLFYKFCRGCPAHTYALTGVPFSSNNKCKWYKKDILVHNDYPFDEFRKISDTLSNRAMNYGNACQNRIKKTLLKLLVTNQIIDFLRAPECWLTQQNMELSEDEMGYILTYIMDKTI